MNGADRKSRTPARAQDAPTRWRSARQRGGTVSAERSGFTIPVAPIHTPGREQGRPAKKIHGIQAAVVDHEVLIEEDLQRRRRRPQPSAREELGGEPIRTLIVRQRGSVHQPVAQAQWNGERGGRRPEQEPALGQGIPLRGQLVELGQERQSVAIRRARASPPTAHQTTSRTRRRRGSGAWEVDGPEIEPESVEEHRPDEMKCDEHQRRRGEERRATRTHGPRVGQRCLHDGE